MAFYNDREEEEQDPNNPQQQGPSAGGSFIQGQGSAPGAAQVSGQASESKPDNPGNFVGIQKYIDQNKGQARTLAGQVGNYVKGQGQEAQTALEGAQQQFGNQVQSGTINQDPTLLNQVKTNATALAQNQDQAGQFAKMRDAQYKGPASLDQGADYFQPVMQAINKAKTSGQQTGTVEGRSALLQGVQNQANNKASAGAASLDNAILGTSPESKKILSRAKSSNEGLDQSLSAAQQQALGQVNAAKATTQQTAQAARDALTQGYQGLGSDLASREAAKDAEQQQFFNSFKDQAGAHTLTPDQLAKLGISAGDVSGNVNIGDYLKYADGADKYSVATQDDLARQNALKQLAGDYDLGPQILNSAVPLGQTKDPFTFDKAGYEKAATAQTDNYDTAVRALMKQKGVNPSSSPAAFVKNYKLSPAEKAKLAKYSQQKAGQAYSDRDSRPI